MAKFYVSSGKNQLIVQDKYPVQAATVAYMMWREKNKEKIDKTVRVSEVGFDGEHPHHENDSTFTTNFIKELARNDPDEETGV